MYLAASILVNGDADVEEVRQFVKRLDAAQGGDLNASYGAAKVLLLVSLGKWGCTAQA